MSGTRIGSGAPTHTQNTDFTYGYTNNFSVNVNGVTQSASISAQLGFQGSTDFMVSMDAGYIMTYTEECQTVGLGRKYCFQYPNYATNYFDTTSG